MLNDEYKKNVKNRHYRKRLHIIRRFGRQIKEKDGKLLVLVGHDYYSASDLMKIIDNIGRLVQELHEFERECEEEYERWKFGKV